MLNASYEPLKVVNWKKAIVLWFQGKVDVLEHHNVFVRSVDSRFPVPSVIRLRSYVRLTFQQQIRFCRDNIYRRDKFTCQYCATKFPSKELTLDHVLPASKGGQRTWHNIVSACKKCNQRKGNKTPEQANMPLLNRPSKPKWLPEHEVHTKETGAPDIWKDYLFIETPDTTDL